MRISAKADYAVRAAAELATVRDGQPVTAERLAEAQGIPLKFLENILVELRHARIVHAQRGPVGGYRLARPPVQITIADIVRAVDGPLATIRDHWPEELEYAGAAEQLRDVWVAVRASLRSVLESVTLAHLAEGKLPARVEKMTADPDAWQRR